MLPVGGTVSDIGASPQDLSVKSHACYLTVLVPFCCSEHEVLCVKLGFYISIVWGLVLEI